MSVYFDPNIKDIFAPYIGAMSGISIATDEGTFSLDLSNYKSVCRLSQRIKIAIEGHRKGSKTAHPMPPGKALEKNQIDMYNEWLDNGMPEKEDSEAFNGIVV